MEEDKYERLQTLLSKGTLTNHYYDQTTLSNLPWLC